MTECHLGCRKINLTLFKSLNYSELKKKHGRPESSSDFKNFFKFYVFLVLGNPMKVSYRGSLKKHRERLFLKVSCLSCFLINFLSNAC